MIDGFDAFNDPEVSNLLHELRTALGYRLPEVAKLPFRRFHSWMTSAPEPPRVTHLRSGQIHGTTWYAVLAHGVLGSAQNALASVYYHRTNMKRMESRMLELAKGRDLQKLLGSTTIGIGNTLALDSEYQAFILATRRCIDYHLRGLAAYFGQEYRSLHKLRRALPKFKPPLVAAALEATLSRLFPNYERLLSDGTDKSLRDQITHWNFVSAGCLNVLAHGIFLVGGGEDLPFAPLNPSPLRLRDALDRYVDDLELFVAETIDCVVAADRRLPR